MEAKQKIFMVEDDPNFGAVMKAYLEMNDYEVTWIEDGKNAMDEFTSGEYDLCILDVMLPNKDGFRIAEEIKEITASIPLIFLTAKTLKKDVLKGYKAGADDYITKPFDSDVLICKIQAILKRNHKTNESNSFRIGQFTFDYKLRTISGNNMEEQKLSPKEAQLLYLLCKNMNEVLRRDLALKTIWKEDSYFTTRSMDVFITKLRKHLKDDSSVEIENIHGTGYRLKV
ncbi:MAG: response regulator transcription factor [Bacteroidales bacterium]|nr:response regulator transcription factor [Bacteroidales bacterium]